MNKLIYIILVLVVIGTTPAFAHKLLWVSDENTTFQTASFIPDPFTNSYFTLEEFTRQGQSHWYSFVGIEGQEVFIQTLVPDIASSRDFEPCFDLLIGDAKVTPKVMKKEFHEEFSDTDWIITCELTITLPDDGLYYIRAHDQLDHYEVGDTGKFSLSIGTTDEFSLLDWIQLPIWLVHLHLFFENNLFVAFVLLISFIVMILLVIALTNNRNK